MSVSNLFKPGGLVWRPDANDVNAPDGTLLRADNMVPDEDGALTCRRGSQELYNFPNGTEDVHSLYTVELSDGYTYRMMAADSQMNKNPGPGNHTAHWERLYMAAADFEILTQLNYTGGSWEKTYASTGDVGPVVYTSTWESDYTSLLWSALEPVNFNVTFDGTGDIAIGDDHQQVFMARGTTSKKFDGKSFMEWGIAKPNAAATVSAVAPTSTSILTCASGETGGTISYWPNALGGTAGVTRLAAATFVPDSEAAANQATRLIPGRGWGMEVGSINKVFATDQDYSGELQDVFDVRVLIEDPKHCREINMTFFVGDDDTSSRYDQWYRFRFKPKSAIEVPIRDTTAEGESAYEAKVNTILDAVDAKDKPRVNTPEDVKAIVANVGDQASPTTGGSAPPAGEWVHLSVTRGQFEQTGSATGRGWATVRQVMLEVRNDDGQLGGVHFSDFVMYSAGTGTLTGTYKIVYRWVRDTDRYYETSPPSAESAAINLFANQLKVTIPGATQNAADDQVDTVWVYLFGGWLDTYYRVATATADPQLSTDLVVNLEKNEIQILTENERLEPYLDTPRDNIIAVAGPWNGRLFTLTSEGYVYPSLQTSPSTFNTFQVIDLSRQGDPLWMVKTSSGIHVGAEKDIVFLAGSGDESVDRTVIDLYPHPLNIGTPPADSARYVDGNSILYRSTDGLVMLASQGLQHIPDGGTRLLWRGQTRHGVSGLNVSTGRFRLTTDNKILWMLAPEGTTTSGTTVIYRLDIEKGQWSRLTYPNSLLSLITEPDGTLIAGSDDGVLLQLEYQTGDESVNPTVVIHTPYMDGGAPLTRKDAFDLQFHTDTNGNTATVNLHKDGASASTSNYTFSTSQNQVYRMQAEDFGTFIKAQMKITGTFDEFILSALDLTYRTRPQHMTYLDTGYILPADPGDIAWLQEVELDANSPSNISCLLYLDDSLFTTETVSVTANVRTVYRIPLPRGSKGRRPRLVFKTTASDGAGEIGFDPYAVRVRARSSGNQAEAQFLTVWPAGQAP